MSNPSNLSESLAKYENQFDELEVEERTPIIDLNAINPLSEVRERTHHCWRPSDAVVQGATWFVWRRQCDLCEVS